MDVFLRLQGLVQAVGVTSALHEPSRELVDDYYLAVLDHIFAVPQEYGLGLEGVLDEVNEVEVSGVV